MCKAQCFKSMTVFKMSDIIYLAAVCWCKKLFWTNRTMVLHRDVSKLSAERLFLHTARLNEKCPRQQQQGRPPPEVLWVTQTMGESLLQITTVANQSPATCSSMFGAGQSLTQANINCSEVLWPCRVFFSPKKLVFHNSLKLWQERKTSVYWIIMRKWQPSLRE